MKIRALMGLFCLGLLVGCGDGEEASPGGQAGTGGAAGQGGAGGSAGQGIVNDQPHPDCDTLVPEDCGFPFPSNYYLVDDATTASKKRVQFGATTLPKYAAGSKQVNPSAWNDSDGFSPGQGPMTLLRGATVTGLPTQDTIDESLKVDSSPTLLIEAETGKLVPHFAELDMTSKDDNDRIFILRPVVRLKDQTRYIVAIRNVVDAAGAALPPGSSFRELRDKAPSQDASVEARRELYEDIFTRLEAAGVKRENLQISWDYTTASTANNTRGLLHMRDEALKIVGDKGPAYTIDASKTKENPDEHTRRIVYGSMTVPLYLDKPGPGGVMVFDEQGLPKQNGTAEYPFVVVIPNSATTTPAPILQQGHGLLGSRNDVVDEGWVAPFLNSKNFVAISVDWIGLAEEDYDFVATQLAEDVGSMRSMFDRQEQGVVNSLLAMRMMRGALWQDEAMKVDGKIVVDPEQRYYRGDSQGGILGATYMALTTDVQRGLLGVPGMPYNLLLNRSVDFNDFFTLLKVNYSTYAHVQLALGLVQMFWDRVEPNGFAPFIVGNPLPGTPDHNILMHVAIGDHQVSPLGAHIMARTVGAVNLTPAPRPIWGLEEAVAPVQNKPVLVEFKYDTPEAPKTNTPPPGPKSEDTHSRPRKSVLAQTQTDKFLREGVVIQTCDGACDPD